MKAAFKSFQDWQKLKRCNYKNILKIAQLRKREEKLNHLIARQQEEISTLRIEVEQLNSYITSELCETVMFHDGEEEEEEVEGEQVEGGKVEVGGGEEEEEDAERVQVDK